MSKPEARKFDAISPSTGCCLAIRRYQLRQAPSEIPFVEQVRRLKLPPILAGGVAGFVLVAAGGCQVHLGLFGAQLAAGAGFDRCGRLAVAFLRRIAVQGCRTKSVFTLSFRTGRTLTTPVKDWPPRRRLLGK
jgi:hypothetical protein